MLVLAPLHLRVLFVLQVRQFKLKFNLVFLHEPFCGVMVLLYKRRALHDRNNNNNNNNMS